MPSHYDFANILFAGPCNLRCPYCIGRQIDPGLNRDNLNDFPLRNLGRFVHLLQSYSIIEIILTGATTDPQLYRHQGRLLAWLRRQIPGARISLHTNGQLALCQIAVFNQYDKVCLSLPSFNPDTYRCMTGSPHVPNLAEILRQARIPVKVSCVLTAHNSGEIAEFLARCRDMGLQRLVLRQLFGDARRWPIFDRLPQTGLFQGNPIYSYGGLEITYWRFDQAASRSLNLFSDGAISPHYLLTQARSVDSWGQYPKRRSSPSRYFAALSGL